MSLISVIVPVYKVEPYLSDCIESILKQSFSDFELILIDDGSPDNCGKICDVYAELDNRIRVIHQVNAGLSAARNAGLDSITGSYVTFIDSDDMIADTYLECLYMMIQDTDAQIAACGFKTFHDSDNLDTCNSPFKPDTHAISNREAIQGLYKNQGIISITAWGKLYDSRLFDDIRFPVGKIHEDQAVVPLIFYNAEKICLSSNQLYLYRQRDGSIMNSVFSIKRYDDIEAIDKCIMYFKNHNENSLALAAEENKQHLLSIYTLKVKHMGIYNQVPRQYRMSTCKALKSIRDTTSNDYYRYILEQYYPYLVQPHEYIRKIKQILHIPCN